MRASRTRVALLAVLSMPFVPLSGVAGATPPSEAAVEKPPGTAFTPTFTASDCPVADPAAVAGEVACGYVTVPLEHDEPGGPTIQLAVATFPERDDDTDDHDDADDHADDDDAPLVLLAGGPGELLVTPVLEALASGVPVFEGLHEDRDLVLVDQRGVGASRPALDCPEVFAALAGPVDALPAAYAACRDRLVADGVELSAFDTRNDVEDIDMVREALGHEEVHLFGTSYGARLALQVAGEHPDGLASLVLSSPVPAEANFVADAGTSYDRALHALDEACAMAASCAAFAPDLLETFEATLAELAEMPAEVPYTDPTTGETQVLTVDASTLSQLVYSLFYLPGGPSVIPAVIAGAAAGDFSLLLTSAPTFTTAPIAYGMQASFLCAEEAVHTPPSQAPEPETLAAQVLQASNPLLGAGLEAICDIWDVEPAGAETFEPVRTDVPALVVTGQFDQITPPRYGEAVAEALPDATYVEVPGVGHSPLLNVGPCGVELLSEFVDDPDERLDTSCLPTEPEFLSPEDLTSAPAPEEVPAA